MNKSACTVIPLLALFCSLSLVGSVGAEGSTQRVLFEDDFERYTVGTFPSTGGWELWADGAGTKSQIIVDNISAPPTKCFQLIGYDGWAAYPAIRFKSDSQVIGYEVNVRVEEIRVGARDNARVAFCSRVSASILREYAAVFFQDDGKISSGGKVLQSYVAGSWYNVKSILNRSNETYSIWIDGVLLGEDLAVTTTSGDITVYPSVLIEGFSVSQCFNGVKMYFDDVKIFEVTEPRNPRLEVTPSVGLAATTLTGSGFASNSIITVSWNEVAIPTVPSPLSTDGHGTFTAIISVLNQTSSGSYTVKAVDDEGNEATAIFTVDFSGLLADLNQSSFNEYKSEGIQDGDEKVVFAGFPSFSSIVFFTFLLVMILGSTAIYLNRYKVQKVVNNMSVHIRKLKRQQLKNQKIH